MHLDTLLEIGFLRFHVSHDTSIPVCTYSRDQQTNDASCQKHVKFRPIQFEPCKGRVSQSDRSLILDALLQGCMQTTLRRFLEIKHPSTDSSAVFSYRDVTPVSYIHPLHRVKSSAVVPLSNSVDRLRNGSVQHSTSAGLSKRKESRVSMDPLSMGTLSFHNVNYTVGGSGTNSSRQKCCLPCIKPNPGRQILQDVSGMFTTGMNAIMGKNTFFTSKAVSIDR